MFDLSEAHVEPHAVVAQGEGVWVAGTSSVEGEDGRVAAIDPASGAVRWTTAVPDVVSGLAWDPASGTIWAVGGGYGGWGGDPAGGVVRLAGDTGAVLGYHPLAGALSDIAVGGGHAWATDNLSDRLWRLDLATGEADRAVTVPDRPISVAATFSAVWVASPGPGRLTRLDHDGRTLSSADVPGADGVVANGSTVFVGGYTALHRFDAATGQEVWKSVVDPGPVKAWAASDGWVWAWARHGLSHDSIIGFTAEDGRADPEPLSRDFSGDVASSGDSLWLAGGGSGPGGMPRAGTLTEVPLPRRTSLAIAGEQPVDDGTLFGYVRSVDSSGLTFDPAEDFHDPEATTVAGTDGVDITPLSGGVHGFYDRNRDGTTLPFPSQRTPRPTSFPPGRPRQPTPWTPPSSPTPTPPSGEISTTTSRALPTGSPSRTEWSRASSRSTAPEPFWAKR